MKKQLKIIYNGKNEKEVSKLLWIILQFKSFGIEDKQIKKFIKSDYIIYK